jgi:hypothetical protein
MKRIVLSPGLFTPTNPTHRADVGKAFAGILAAIDIAPVAELVVLLKIGLRFVRMFFVFHGAPRRIEF